MSEFNLVNKQRLPRTLLSLSFLVFLVAMFEVASRRRNPVLVATVNGLVSAQSYPDWFFQLLLVGIGMSLIGVFFSLGALFSVKTGSAYARRPKGNESFAARLRSDKLFIVDLLFVCYFGLGALGEALMHGPFTIVAAGGVCLPSLCYEAYPLSIFLYACFLGIVAWRDARAAIPVVAFAISFGELLFPFDSILTYWNPSPFSPFHMLWTGGFIPLAGDLIFIWVSCLVFAPVLLWKLGHKIRFDWAFPAWFALLAVVELWLPYSHTTAQSIFVSLCMMSAQCYVVWRLFGFNVRESPRGSH